MTFGELFLACLSAAGVVAAAIIGVLVTFHMQNRKDRKEELQAMGKQHENLRTIMKEYPLHSHVDGDPRNDPEKVLVLGNIRYPNSHI